MSRQNQQSPRAGMKSSQQSFMSSTAKKNNSVVVAQNKQTNECIKVCIRVRPLLQHELMAEEIVFYPESNDPSLMGIRIADGQHMIESQYDKVFNQYSQQNELFGFVQENIQEVLHGYNATIFAYGQTGSGKTFTMFGPHWDDNLGGHQNTMGTLNLQSSFKSNSSDQFLSEQQRFGIIPRSINFLFNGLNEIQMQNETKSFTVYCSFLQIYNEKLYDLFQDKESNRALNIREDKYTGIFVEGQSEYVVNNANDCFQLLKRGESNRITRQTRANIHSSRSHTIFQILVESDTADERGMLFRGKLNLCDLAGSEKIHKEDTMGAQQFLELKTINLSLSSLGKVISALAQGKGKDHISYRDSKITRLLQDSLGGNTKTTLIAAINSMSDYAAETISTLKFADRAKQIMVKVSANSINAADDALVSKLQKEVQHLKEILNLNRKGGVLDVHQQLLVLKEENSRLKGMEQKVEVVEKLKTENKTLRLELQSLKIQGASDAFRQIQFAPNQDSDSKSQMLAIQAQGSNFGNQSPIMERKQGAFFMTETENFADQQSPPRQQSPPPTTNQNLLYNQNQNLVQQQQNLLIQNKDLAYAGSTVDSRYAPSQITGSHYAPSVLGGQSGGGAPFLPQGQPVYTDDAQTKRLAELKITAASMKGQLAHKGRCPKCTLKPPCKHFDSIDALNETAGLNQSTAEPAGYFYPQKQPEPSITSEAISNKYQRSDGFSVSSSVQNIVSQNGSTSQVQGGQQHTQSGLFQSSAQQILGNNSNRPIGGRAQSSTVPVPVANQATGGYGSDSGIAHRQQQSQPVLPAASPQMTSSIGAIMAEQDRLQKQMLDRLNGTAASPSPSPQQKTPGSMTKQQMMNVMKSGPEGPKSDIQVLDYTPDKSSLPPRAPQSQQTPQAQNFQQYQHQYAEQTQQINQQLTFSQQQDLIKKNLAEIAELSNAPPQKEQPPQYQPQSQPSPLNQTKLSDISGITGYTGVSAMGSANNSEDLYSKQQEIQNQINALKQKIAGQGSNPGSAVALLPPQVNQTRQSFPAKAASYGGYDQNGPTDYSGSAPRNRSQVLMPYNNNMPPPQPHHPGMPPSGRRPPASQQHTQYNPNENDQVAVRIRGRNNFVEEKTGSISRTLSQQDDSKRMKHEVKEGRKRLQALEQLEQYREEKVRKEMYLLDMQRKMEQEKMLKMMEADRKKQIYLEKQKAKVQEFQMKKMHDELEIKKRADKEKEIKVKEKKKFEKDQERNKKRIADYKRKKLEAEEMLANQDLDFDDDDDYYTGFSNEPQQPAVQNNSNSGYGAAGMKMKQIPEQDEEDKYLDDILNRNYGQNSKAPPAVN